VAGDSRSPSRRSAPATCNRTLDTRRGPEYWRRRGLAADQTMLAAGIAVTGAADPSMPWLAIAIVSLVAPFSRNGVLAGMGFLMGAVVLLTLGMQPSVSDRGIRIQS